MVRQQPCPHTDSPGAPREPGGRAGLLHALVLWRLCGPHCPFPSAWGGTGRGQAAGGARTDRAGDTPGAARGQGSQVGGRVTWGPGQWLHKRCTQVLENIKKVWADGAGASRVAPGEKNQPAKEETWEMRVRSLGWEDPLQEGMASHSSVLAWRIPWTEEPGGPQSLGSHN